MAQPRYERTAKNVNDQNQVISICGSDYEALNTDALDGINDLIL